MQLKEDIERIEADIDGFVKAGVYDRKEHEAYEKIIDDIWLNAIQIHGELPDLADKWCHDMKSKLADFAPKP